MISTEEYKRIISELLDELPEEFFRDLTGGVIDSEASVIPDYAQGNDLYTMGMYKIYSGIRQIVMYKGSFDRVYHYADSAQAKDILRGILRHEFRHHMETRAGLFKKGTLVEEDENQMMRYYMRHKPAEEPDPENAFRKL